MRRLLFVTPARFYPEARRGASRSATELLRRLVRRGWAVDAVCATNVKTRGGRALEPADASAPGRPGPAFIVDRSLGFPCWRGTPPQRQVEEDGGHRFFLGKLLELAGRNPPDLVVGQLQGALALLGETALRGLASFFLDRDVDIRDVPGAERVHRIANSPFVASWLIANGHPDPGIVLPIVDSAAYRVLDRRRRFITFINPVVEKGRDVAMEIARMMPEARFLFVHVKRALGASERLSRYGPNVEVREEVDDAREIYRDTDILIHPSQWDEPFGRVILEAQASGIPVVSSDAGGIPFALGRGGVLLRRDAPASAYVEVLRRLRGEGLFYQRLSMDAVKNAARPDLAPERQVDAFIEYVSQRRGAGVEAAAGAVARGPRA
jgi:glycosyltransferase involved in cell wall biosynthesis